MARTSSRLAQRRPRDEPRRGRQPALWAMPWLVGQVLLALALHRLRRPLRRPSGGDLVLWPVALLVTVAFLIPLSQVSLPLAGLAAAAFLLLAWRGWH